MVRRTQPAIAGFEDGRDNEKKKKKNPWKPLEAENNKKMGSLLSLHEALEPLNLVHFKLWTSRTIREYVYVVL